MRNNLLTGHCHLQHAIGVELHHSVIVHRRTTALPRFALDDRLAVRRANFPLNRGMPAAVEASKNRGCWHFAVLHFALGLIAAGQQFDCLCLVAQFGSVSMIA